MASIPVQNETEYDLTDYMADQIIRDAQEYFGEAVRSIRVQYGIERHAYNARTGEVRYAFSPNDFGLIDTTTSVPDTYYHAADVVPTIDDDAEGGLIPTPFGDVAADEESEDEDDMEEEEPRETSLESLEEELDDDEEEEEEGFPELDDQFEDTDEEDSFMYDEDDYE